MVRRAALASLLAGVALPVLSAVPASAATITSANPANGPATGGNVVTLVGTAFDTTGRTRINFGGSAGRNVSCLTTTQCTVTAPAGTGTVTISVSVNGTTTNGPTYTYGPAITKMTPTNGPEAGGTQIRIDGAGFVPGGTTFTVGGFAAALVGACTATRCTITTPAVPAGTGTVNVVARNTATTLTSPANNAAAFTFNPPPGVPATPTVTGLAPNAGRASGGTVVTITGTNFSVTTGATTVRFGATAATNVSCTSVTTCTATSPAGAGAVNVFVAVNGVSSVPSAAATFTYVPAPTVLAVAPNTGNVAGGFPVTVSGSDFSTTPGATTISFGITPATAVTCALTTSCTATAPAAASNSIVDVRVTVDTQTSPVVAADKFTYTGGPAPLITAVTPNTVPTGIAQPITVSGENLLGGTLRIGGNIVAGASCATATTCTATAPISAVATTVNVSVQVGLQTSVASPATQLTYILAVTEPPTGTHIITSFPQRDFVSVEGFSAANGPYTISVVRGGIPAFSVPNLTPDTAGLMEVNHPGGACWPDPLPDIAGGDAIRVTDRFGVAEQTTTAFITTGTFSVTGPGAAPGTTQVKVIGEARTAAGTQLPLGEIEHRFVSSTADPFANGKRTLRAASAPGSDGTLAYIGATTTYVATYDLNAADLAIVQAGAESRGIWLGVGAGGSGSTIYEVGPLVTAGAQAPCVGTLETDTIAPTAPAVVTASVVDFDNVHLVWTAATDNRAVAGYRITRNGTPLVTVSGSTLVFDDLHVPSPVSYTYGVQAIDARTPVPNASIVTLSNTVLTAATPTADLAISVVRTPATTATVGDIVTYDVTVTNIGTAASSGAITVTFPAIAGVTGVASIDAGGTGSPFVTFDCTALISCTTLPTVALGPGADKKIRFTGIFTTAAVPVLTATFTVAGGNDNVAANNTTTDIATVLSLPGAPIEPPDNGHGIIAFPGRDFVSGTGFTPGELLTVEVWRSVDGGPLNRVAQSLGLQTGADGVAEVNHPGGSCWGGDPLHPFGTATPGTPNLQPGDKVRYILADGTSYQITTAGVKVNRPENPAPGVLVVRGSAQDANGQPLPLDQIEQRIIAGTNVGFFEVNGGKRRIGAPGEGTLVYDSPTSINWTATYTGLSQHDIDLAMIAESRALWLGRDPLAGAELTIFENDPAVVKGPSAPCITPADTVTPIQGAPDLAVTSTHAGDFTVGVDATYNLTLTNVGTKPVTGQIEVIDQLPVGLNYLRENSADFDCLASGRKITCVSDTDVAVGAALTIPIDVSVASAAVGTVQNFAEVSAALDISSLNNFAFDSTVVKAPVGTAVDLSVTSTHVGDFTATTNGQYTITVANAGVDPSSGTITVTDTLPAGLTYVSGGNATWLCGAVGQTVTCTSNIVLATGASSSFPINVLVGAAAVPSVTNTVTVAPVDANAADNTDSDVTVVFPEVRAPDGGLHMLVFPSRDFVAIDGLTAAQGPVVVEARRNGVVIGTTTPQPVLDDPSTAAFEGLVEINHIGVTDCWTVAPDLKAGDEIRLIDAQGRKFHIFVAGIRTDRSISVGGNVIEVHGTAVDSAGLPLPIGQLEQRIIKDKNAPLFVTNGRRDLRTGGDGTITYDSPGAIAWTARYTLNAADVAGALAGESRIVWSPNLLAGNDLTIFENGTGVVGGAAAPTCAGGNAAPAANLGVTISGPALPVGSGNNANITFTVTNSGPTPVTGAVLQITVPATVTRVRSNGGTLNLVTANPVAPTFTVTINNTIAAGASGTYILQVRTSTLGRTKITAAITSATTSDFVPTNDFTAAFYTV